MINGGQPGDDVTGRVLDRCEFTDWRGWVGRKKRGKYLKEKYDLVHLQLNLSRFLSIGAQN